MSENITDEEWEQRTLCPDESCIGVLGPDGRCKECGKTGEAPHPTEQESRTASAPPSSAPQPFAADEEDEPADEAASDAKSADETDADDEWSRRTLCSDESCIGVIGPDGRCKECGRPYQTAAGE